MPSGNCQGRNLDDHCCYVGDKACEFLEENTEPGFRWSCGLRRELGDWDLVLIDQRYINGPGKVFEPLGMNCRDFPTASQGCGNCGLNK